jgi:riboflavin transporter 2
VLFMPYFGRFRDIYLVTYLIGEGLSGLLPGVLGLIQGVGGNAQCKLNNSTDENAPKYVPYWPPPRFTTRTFFLIISSLFVASFIAFVLLDRLKSVRKEYCTQFTVSHGNKYKENTEEKTEQEDKVKKLSLVNYRGLLILLGTVCMFVNAIFPSIMPFGSL